MAEARRFTAIALGITAVATVLRVWQASRTELWFDEIFTLWIARLPWTDMFRAIASDVHPPLHFMIVKLWRAAGGEASLWIKLSSVLPGVLLVAALAPIGRAMFGARAGLIAAALLALSATHVMVSQEARFYPWLALWAWLAIGLAWRWIERPSMRVALAFVTVETLGLYTHYLCGVIDVFLFLWGLALLAREPRRIGSWIGLHVAIALLFAPQLPILALQMTRETGEHWIRPPGASALIGLTRRIAFSALYLIPIALGLALVPLFRREQHRAASLIVAVTLLVIAVTFALTRMGAHLFTERYMFWVIPGACLLIGAALATLRPAWLAALLGLALAVQGARTIASAPFPEARDLGKAAVYLEQRVGPNDQVLCADTHSLTYMRQHARGLPAELLIWPTARVPYYDGALVIPSAWYLAPSALDSLNSAHQRWWAVRVAHGGPEQGPGARLFGAAGGQPVMVAGDVTVWRGP